MHKLEHQIGILPKETLTLIRLAIDPSTLLNQQMTHSWPETFPLIAIFINRLIVSAPLF